MANSLLVIETEIVVVVVVASSPMSVEDSQTSMVFDIYSNQMESLDIAFAEVEVEEEDNYSFQDRMEVEGDA